MRTAMAAAVAALWVGAAGAVYPPAIKDDGKFLSAKGLEKANAKIKDIYKKYKKDVVLETIEALTADQMKELEKDSAEEFFDKWAKKRTDELGVNGVYVAIVKKPRHVRIDPDPATRKAGFTSAKSKYAFEQFKGLAREDMDGAVFAMLEAIEDGFAPPTKKKDKDGKPKAKLKDKE